MYKSQRLQVEVKQHISNVICFDLVPRGHDLHLQLSTGGFAGQESAETCKICGFELDFFWIY